jgi:4-hydroxybenzoate polyprenyltransferase
MKNRNCLLKDILALLRPYQYSKNLFIFAPAFFSFRYHEEEVLQTSVLSFLIFCIISSAVYALNDCLDQKADRLHPDKKQRPVAAGRISRRTALLISMLLFLGGIAAAGILLPGILLPLAIYIILNTLYSAGLKQVSILDIFIIATGFVIRLFVGSNATGIILSQWIIVMTFLLALFLSLAKRRADVLIYLKTEQKMRRVIDGYNLKFLDSSIAISAAIVMMAYILWALSPETCAKLGGTNIYISSVFVLLGIFRYMQLIFVNEKGGDPARIVLKDRFLQITIICWLSSFFRLAGK